MIADVECPTCYGTGEVIGTTPSQRSRYVRHDDLDPGDYTVTCPRCLGYGTVERDLDDECE